MRIIHLSDGTTLTPSRGRWEKQKQLLPSPSQIRMRYAVESIDF
jgi:hypothetical protein